MLRISDDEIKTKFIDFFNEMLKRSINIATKKNMKKIIFVVISRKCYKIIKYLYDNHELDINIPPESVDVSLEMISDRKMKRDILDYDDALICLMDDTLNYAGAMINSYLYLSSLIEGKNAEIIVSALIINLNIEKNKMMNYYFANKIGEDHFFYKYKKTTMDMSKFILDEINFIHSVGESYIIELPLYEKLTIDLDTWNSLIHNGRFLFGDNDITIDQKIHKIGFFIIDDKHMVNAFGKILQGLYIKCDYSIVDDNVKCKFCANVFLKSINVNVLEAICRSYFKLTNSEEIFSTMFQANEQDSNAENMYKFLIYTLSYYIGKKVWKPFLKEYNLDLEEDKNREKQFTERFYEGLETVNFYEWFSNIAEYYDLGLQQSYVTKIVTEQQYDNIKNYLLDILEKQKHKLIHDTQNRVSILNNKFEHDSLSKQQIYEIYEYFSAWYEKRKEMSIEDLESFIKDSFIGLSDEKINYILSRFIMYVNDCSLAGKTMKLENGYVIREIKLGELSNILTGSLGEFFYCAFYCFYNIVYCDMKLYEKYYEYYLNLLTKYLMDNGLLKDESYRKRFSYYSLLYDSFTSDIEIEMYNKRYLVPDSATDRYTLQIRSMIDYMFNEGAAYIIEGAFHGT